ncbi:NADPH dehydrogenase NamA [bacterium LRH843]|nr:NADPH dehydrogenase NamA [bacterium LRH843]
MTRKLFSPFDIKNVTLKNRIVMSPMCMYSCEPKDGHVQPFHLTHYETRAVGQVGLIIVEATSVTPQGRISDKDLGIWSDDHVEGLKAIVNRVHAHGAKAAIQLAHAGRKSTVSGDIFAPSALPFDEKSKTPVSLTEDAIKQKIEAFRNGAKRAKEAGFDIIELHGAHGYLINQFLSPLTNKRTDQYGGSLQERYQFLKEVIYAVKDVWDGPLFVRISADEYTEEGNTLDDFVQLSSWMREDGVDLIDVSTGGVVPANINVFPGYQVKHAETIRKEADIAIGAVGMITSGLQADEILNNGRADLIFLARELLRDPYWPLSAAKELKTTIESPKQYERGWLV